MNTLTKNGLNRLSYALIATLMLLFVAVAPLAAAPVSGSFDSLSGDAAYDPADGGLEALSVWSGRSMSRAASTFSGNDAYDLAAGAFPGLFVASFAGSLSGDAAYDAAAGGLAFGSAGSMSRAASTFSGNDAYDLAAGAFPGLFLASFAGSLSGDAAYDAAAGGLAGLSSFGASEAAFCEPGDLAIAGGYGGDDAYDAAAGGSPGGEQALLACASGDIAMP